MAATAKEATEDVSLEQTIEVTRQTNCRFVPEQSSRNIVSPLGRVFNNKPGGEGGLVRGGLASRCIQSMAYLTRLVPHTVRRQTPFTTNG